MFVPIPTERTTAGTDAILALIAVACMAGLWRLRGRDGLRLSARVIWWLWQPLYLAPAIAVALFVIGAVYDLRGADAARRAPMGSFTSCKCPVSC